MRYMMKKKGQALWRERDLDFFFPTQSTDFFVCWFRVGTGYESSSFRRGTHSGPILAW